MTKGVLTGSRSDKFEWNEMRLSAAMMLSWGTMYQVDVAAEIGCTPERITAWKQYKEFIAKVDELTLEHETVTKAGLLREAMNGLDIKRKNMHEDKSTHLDYLKEIADIQGFKKQKVELEGGINVAVKVTVSEAVKEYEELLTELAKSD